MRCRGGGGQKRGRCKEVGQGEAEMGLLREAEGVLTGEGRRELRVLPVRKWALAEHRSMMRLVLGLGAPRACSEEQGGVGLCLKGEYVQEGQRAKGALVVWGGGHPTLAPQG